MTDSIQSMHDIITDAYYDPRTGFVGVEKLFKTNQNRHFDAPPKLQTQCSRNRYKNNIKSMKCYGHRNH